MRNKKVLNISLRVFSKPSKWSSTEFWSKKNSGASQIIIALDFSLFVHLDISFDWCDIVTSEQCSTKEWIKFYYQEESSKSFIHANSVLYKLNQLAYNSWWNSTTGVVIHRHIIFDLQKAELVNIKVVTIKSWKAAKSYDLYLVSEIVYLASGYCCSISLKYLHIQAEAVEKLRCQIFTGDYL